MTQADVLYTFKLSLKSLSKSWKLGMSAGMGPLWTGCIHKYYYLVVYTSVSVRQVISSKVTIYVTLQSAGPLSCFKATVERDP